MCCIYVYLYNSNVNALKAISSSKTECNPDGKSIVLAQEIEFAHWGRRDSDMGHVCFPLEHVLKKINCTCLLIFVEMPI